MLVSTLLHHHHSQKLTSDLLEEQPKLTYFSLKTKYKNGGFQIPHDAALFARIPRIRWRDSL